MGWRGAFRAIAAAQRHSERQELRRHNELKKQLKQELKLLEQEEASLEVELHETYMELLTSVHKECSSLINWVSVKSAEPPTMPSQTKRSESLALQALEAYEPSLQDKVLRRVEAKRDNLVNAIREARQADQKRFEKEVEAFLEAKQEWEEQQDLASKVLNGDKAAYLDVIRELNPFSEIDQIGSSIKIAVRNSSRVEVRMDVNGEHVIPKETKTLLKSGKVSTKEITKTRFFELYQDYVCSCVLRVGREIFALLPVETIVVTARGEKLNPATGHMESCPILSVLMPRIEFQKLNFDLIDPSDSMSNFITRMGFKRGVGFDCVEPLGFQDPEGSTA